MAGHPDVRALMSSRSDEESELPLSWNALWSELSCLSRRVHPAAVLFAVSSSDDLLSVLLVLPESLQLLLLLASPPPFLAPLQRPF